MTSGRGRRGWAFALVLTIALGIIGVAVLVQRQRRDQALAEARSAYGALRHCLLGAPLAEGELASERVHRIAIGIPLRGSGANVSRESPWPRRCAEHAERLHDRLVDARDESNLAALADDLRLALRGPNDGDYFERTHAASMDAFFALAERTLGTTPRGSGPPPPPATAPLTRADLHALVELPDREGHIHGAGRSDPASSFVVGIEERRACAFLPPAAHEGAFTSALCLGSGVFDRVPAGSEPRVFSSDDAAPGVPPIVLGFGPTAYAAGLPGTQRAVATQFLVDGTLAADGSVTLLHDVSGRASLGPDRGSSRWRLRHVARDGSVHGEIDLELPPGASRAWLLPDRVLWTVTSERETTLVTRALSGDAGILGPIEEIGAVRSRPQRLASCAFEGGSALVMQDFDGGLTDLAFRMGERWSAPIAVPIRDDFGAFTCRSREASFTWVEGASDKTVHQARCTPERCVSSAETVERIAPRVVLASDYWVTSFGERAVIAWGGVRGGIRMRMAPVGELGAADEVLLFDDAAHEGAVVSNASFFQRRGVAVLLFQLDGDDGPSWYAIRIDERGRYSAVRRFGS